jgi:serine/threonine protein kinase
MHSDDTAKVRELFWAASALESVEARERYLDKATASDAVRDEVRALLEHRRPSDRPRTGTLLGPAIGTTQPVTTGMSVEGFRLLRVLGTGGAGVVYEAEQDDPKRLVALKLLRPEYISRTATRRLSFEADVLGSLRHVGIAQVHAAGVHDDPTGDRPYFAMELVSDAKPITEYADDEYIALEDRLRLMAAVCDAAQYAHRRGVVHRDLKPSNILVDSDGQAKLIDFGIAQSDNRGGLTHTLHTRTGNILGTIAYMSPEQAGGRPVDTRGDVYALGVVLYELVTGRLPYDFDQRTPYEALRLIREAPPRRPRSVSPNLPADIESIILKALDHDPGHRYQSAGEFSEDIKRFLHHKPVAARPPSAWRGVRQ